MSNFTNTKIKDTYQRVLQIDNGEIQDGLGLPVDARIQSLESDLGFTGDLDGTATLAIGLTSGDKTIQGNLDVIGKITAIEIYAQYESASIIYSSGSTKFGDTFDDTHQFTGSVSITGSSFSYNGYNVITSNDTSSIVVDSASYATFAATASYLLGGVSSASYALTASYIQLSGVDGFTVYSSSISSRVTNLENFSSSLDATFATDAQLNAATASLSSSIASLSSSYLSTSASFSSGINANTNSISALSSSFISFSGSYNTGSFTGSFTGNLTGTSSYAVSASHALNADNAISASYALTASYVNPLKQNVLITGSLYMSGSIYTPESIYFSTTASAVTQVGQLGWDDGYGTLDLMLKGGNVNVELGQENVVLVYNGNGTTLTRGEVVFVSGSQGNRPSVNRALATTDGYSATTLGFAAESIPPGEEGYVTTFGFINNINTNGLVGGSPVWLSPTTPGGWTTTKPVAPQHTVLLGYIVRVHPTVGSIFVHISNGWEIGELHDVRDTTTTSSFGDLIVKSGSIWVTNKQLTGSYGLTGSLSFVGGGVTGSLFGTSSWAVNAQTASLAPNYVLTSVTSSMLAPYVLTSQTSSMSVASASVATSASYALTASFALNGGGGAAFPFSGSAVISGSLFVSSSTTNVLTIQGSGSAQPIFTVQGSAGQLFAITDSLSGSLFSVNDISGLPILEVFSDNTILLGDYQAPTLYTTKRVTSIVGNNVIYSLATSSYDGAFFDYVAKSGSNARAGNIMALWSGTSVNFTETTTTDFGNTSGLAFTAFISGSNLVLSGSTSTANWNIKTIIRSI
jgi:hypothetical protein